MNREFIFKTSEWREQLPNHIYGLYYFYVEEQIVYIGKSINVRQRLCTHFDDTYKHEHHLIDYDKITKIRVVEGIYSQEIEEISKHKPKWNVNHHNGYIEKKDNVMCYYCEKRHDPSIECEIQKKLFISMIEKMNG